MKFSDRTIAALPIPEAGQKFYADDTPCLYIRTSCGGSKSFLFIHGKERRKITLGRYPTMSLAHARSEAKRLLAEKTLGTLSTKSRPYSMIWMLTSSSTAPRTGSALHSNTSAYYAGISSSDRAR